MFCPSCGGEYREGFTHCADCDVDLVEAHPAPPAKPPEPAGLETVFSTGDPVELMTAKSLLDDARIPYVVRNEALQDLFGLGRLGTGFNIAAGPMELRVGAERRQEAEDLLRAAGAALQSALETPWGDEERAEEGEEGG